MVVSMRQHYLSSWNQTIKPRPCIGGLEGQQPNSPGHRPGCCMPCDDSASERQKHFPPDDNAFALSGRSGCYVPVTPGCYPGLVAHCPRQGRIRQLGWRIVTQQKKCRRHHLQLRIRENGDFVKEYLCVVIKGLRNVNDVWHASIVPPFDI